MLQTIIVDYINQRKSDQLQKFDKSSEKQRQMLNQLELNSFDAEQRQKRQKLENKYLPANWLDSAAIRTKQISVATHILKFIHSDAKGSNIYDTQQYTAAKTAYVTTGTHSSFDVTGNAAALDVAKFLLLVDDGRTVLQAITANDDQPLRAFARTEAQLQTWMAKFKQVVADSNVQSHTLAKQIYFPVSPENGDYHLLMPLYASSLAHELYQRIQTNRYGDVQKTVRKAKKEGKYCEHNCIRYPNLMLHGFGGTKPQNISLLNSQRHGQSYLLNTASPVWENRAKPPSKNIFTGDYYYKVRKKLYHLKKYLHRVKAQSSNINMREHRKKCVDELIETLILHASDIRNLASGWSIETSSMPIDQQYWLDPGRAHNDKDFAESRAKMDWLEEVAEQFAAWLNRHLTDAVLLMGDAEYIEWKYLLLDEIKRMEKANA